jgi:DNA-binding winged helix-turn-helix (wHTH) protein/TolB-like protein/tetratricopeptide (TPR) repeat protein
MNAKQRPDGLAKVIELAEEDDFSLGEMRVLPSSRGVVFNGAKETLEPRVMQVLVALARRQGEVVSRDQLIESCWNGRVVGEDALNRSITKVRRFAAPTTFAIETIPRVGYRLSIAVPHADTALLPSPAASAPVRPPRKHWLRWAVPLFAIVIASILYGIRRGEELILTASRPYFAVLTFDNVAADPPALRFVEAVPTAISNRLTAQGYKVVSPAVSFQYRGERKARAAQELTPRYVIDGAVRIVGDRVRVTVRIDAVSKPVTVWSYEFIAGAAEAGELPERIALAVAEMFNPGTRAIFESPPEITAGLITVASHWRAADDIGAYVASRELLRKTSNNLMARIYFGIATGIAFDELAASERAAVLAEARRLASDAGRQAWTGAPLALFQLLPMVDWARREAILRKGLDNEFADTAGLRRALATQLLNSGRVSEALALAEQSLIVNPLASNTVATRLAILDVAGNADEAEAALRAAEHSWPDLLYMQRMRFSLALARRDAAAAGALLADPRVGPNIDAPAERRPYAGIVRAIQSHAAADIATVETQCDDPTRLARFAGRTCLQALAVLGQTDAFFRLAPAYFPEQRAATAQQRDALWIANPRMHHYMRVLFRKDAQAIRADERFIAIAERTGLLDYWRASGKQPDFCRHEAAPVCARIGERRS